MPRQTALVIDATRPEHSAESVRPEAVASVRALLRGALEGRGADVDFFSPEPSRLAHCIGCFSCWVEHPGVCRYRDGIEDVLVRVVASDIVVLLTHLTFGGYSATLKQVLERMLGLLLPDFVLADGELSHPPRYARTPRLVGIGVRVADPIEDLDARIFRALVGRTARNLHADGHSSALIRLVDEPGEQRAAIEAALDRREPIPDLTSIAGLIASPTPVSPAAAGVPGRVLLVVGSPRRLKRSTSSVLGERLLDGLHRAGWMSETITITSGIQRELPRAALAEAFDAADLVILAFGLYFDTMPCLLTRALELLADRGASDVPVDRQLAAVVNSSFPQAAQSALALAIAGRFAQATGLRWAGGLSVGAGPWIDGRQLSGAGRTPLPTGRLAAALDMAARSLARRQPIPDEAVRLAALSPIAGLPFALWQRAYGAMTGLGLRRMATAAAVDGTRLLARPYEATSDRGPP